MIYLILGILLLIFGIYFLRRSIKEDDKEGVVGFTVIMIAAFFLIVFFGLFFGILFK